VIKVIEFPKRKGTGDVRVSNPFQFQPTGG
jgi:hypothetical protein